MLISYTYFPSIVLLLATVSGVNAENNARTLQGEDPCTSDNAYFRHLGLVDALRPSFFTQCASSLSVDPNNMKLHIESLNEIFKSYHCFYDIAKDPDASDGAFQPELGNTIYGDGGGQVNIDAELNAIIEDIDAKNFSSLATFWEVHSVFNRLHDGHVALPTVEQTFYDFTWSIVPERFVGEEINLLLPRFYFDENQNLQLTVGTEAPINSGNIELKNVTTINGQSVAEFMTYLANTDELSLFYQDVGARVNYLIQNDALFSTGIIFGFRGGTGTPSNLLPDSFIVTYDDGTSETYLTGIIASDVFYSWASKSGDPGFMSIDRTIAEPFINQPGEQFDAYQRAAGQISDLSEGERERRRTRKTTLSSEPTSPLDSINIDPENNNLLRHLQVSPRQPPSNFSMIIPGVGGYLVEEDYVVFKLSTFQVDYDSTTQLWIETVNAAKQNGIKNLIVDISGNGGGSVVVGFRLLFLMFPEAGLEWFTNQWEINWNNPMTQYIEAFAPLLEIVVEQLIDVPDEVFVDHIESFTDTVLEVYQVAADGILELCFDSVNLLNPDPVSREMQCQQTTYLHANITNFVSSPDLVTYIELALSLIETMVTYTPWSVVLEQPEATNPNITSELLGQGIQTVMRGGVESNVTAKFDLLGPLVNEFIHEDSATLSASLDYTFDEYIILSDGVAGSMAAIFSFEASQLYKNRDRSGVETKVTLAAYGGLGNEEDFTVASFPASVQGVTLEDPIIGDAAISLFAILLPFANLTGFDEVFEEISEYSESVAIPPYFGDTLPIMPVASFYNIFMEPGALPLQYVSTPLDAYIPEMFTRVSFAVPDDLPVLYDAASSFFSNSMATPTPAPVPVPDMTDPPVMEPTPSEAPETEGPTAPDMTPAPVPVGTTDPPVEPPIPSQTPGTDVSPTEPPETGPPTEGEPGSSASFQKSAISLVGIVLAILQLL